MTRRAATTLLALSAVVLLFVVGAFVGQDGGEPRADLVETAASRTLPVPTSPLAPMRMVPLPTTVDPGAAAVTGPGTDPAGRVAAPPPPHAPGVEPARLQIPSLGVDAPVVPVGLEPDGSMELPGATQVGWYEPTGTRPGDARGSAVLAAHVDHQGRRGVFFDLRSLPEGAEVVVTGPDGTPRRFGVESRFQVDKDALPVEELFRTDGEPTLALITCGGAFDRSSRHYEDNIVILATPI